jgi:hypothetical protein
MTRRNAGTILGLLVIGAILLSVPLAFGETIRWTNPTTGTDNAGNAVALTAEEQGKITNYLRYRTIGGTWTYFAETRGGKTSWTGSVPVADGVAADYSVSAALLGADGVERDSWSKGEAAHSVVRYTRPFPAGPTPEVPGGLTITKD